MQIKLDASIEKVAGNPESSSWYGRKITLPFWMQAALLAVVYGSGMLTLALVRPIHQEFGTRAQAPPSAAFLHVDGSTQGNWKGGYGSSGFALANDAARLPAYGRVTLPKTDKPVTWSDGIDSLRALQKVKSKGRIAATWWAWGSFDIGVNLTDDQTHRVSLYLLDWDSNTRVENIEVLNALSGNVLDVRQSSKFADGEYFSWNISGHVTIRVTHITGANAVASAIFFD